jgi:hypothetical protein
MPRSLIPSVALASALSAPAASFAQSNGPVTRGRVRAELIQAGWHPAICMGNNPDNPAGVQAVEARIAAPNQVTDSYGGVAAGVSASGAPTATRFEATGNTKPIYFGH